MTCCFIGHKEPDKPVFPDLIFAIDELICDHGVDTFYIGNNGWFDRTCFNIVRNLQENYPHIKYNVVLAYYPARLKGYEDNTLYPEGLELVPKKFAIAKRNRWMIDNSDYVVCHVTNTVTNSYKFLTYAEKHGKKSVRV